MKTTLTRTALFAQYWATEKKVMFTEQTGESQSTAWSKTSRVMFAQALQENRNSSLSRWDAVLRVSISHESKLNFGSSENNLVKPDGCVETDRKLRKFVRMQEVHNWTLCGAQDNVARKPMLISWDCRFVSTHPVRVLPAPKVDFYTSNTYHQFSFRKNPQLRLTFLSKQQNIAVQLFLHSGMPREEVWLGSGSCWHWHNRCWSRRLDSEENTYRSRSSHGLFSRAGWGAQLLYLCIQTEIVNRVEIRHSTLSWVHEDNVSDVWLSVTATLMTNLANHEAKESLIYGASGICLCAGYFSWRNNYDGSWFVQAIVRVFREHWDLMELMQMMTLVSKVVAYDFQSCTGLNSTKRQTCYESLDELKKAETGLSSVNYQPLEPQFVLARVCPKQRENQG